MTARLREILLVDDSEADNYIHRRVIQKSGVVETVSVARNGQEALDHLAQSEQPPELIFLDINMPVLDGWGFLEGLKELPEAKRHSVVITMLTTSQNQRDRARAESLGVVAAFIVKPLIGVDLVAIVEEHFPQT